MYMGAYFHFLVKMEKLCPFTQILNIKCRQFFTQVILYIYIYIFFPNLNKLIL